MKKLKITLVAVLSIGATFDVENLAMGFIRFENGAAILKSGVM